MKANTITYYLIVFFICFACSDNHPPKNSKNIPDIDVAVNYKKPDNNDIKKQSKGLYCNGKETIGIIDSNDTIAIVEISAPSIVAIADVEYPWGWFQFPTMGMNKDGIISVVWQMKNDSVEDYGDSPGTNNTKVSFDNGDTWVIPHRDLNIPAYREAVLLENGDVMALSTQPSEDISSIDDFPNPLYTIDNLDFYYERDLPDRLKGIYINYINNRTKETTNIHAKVNNDNLIRYSVNRMMSTFWWGKLFLKGNDLYAGVYPSYYADTNGNLKPQTVSFYKSTDLGNTWNLQGAIDYQINESFHPTQDFNRKCFTEPTFEFLKDGSIICVMRTSEGSITPMYKSYSNDQGVSWSIPEPVTPNGVMPSLIRLDSDVLILASGRPGIQLRFSLDGKGEQWTTPIELIDFDETNNSYKNSYEDTCGYPFMLKASDNEVFIVYSNFKEKNSEGQNRKSIIFRKIKVYRL